MSPSLPVITSLSVRVLGLALSLGLGLAGVVNAKRGYNEGALTYKVTGQLADKPTRGQSSRGLDNSRTGQLTEMFDLRFGVYNSSKCYFGQITLFIRCQYSIGLELGLVLGLMYK